MHLGMNDNILFNGITFHVQTEDSGVNLPFITTHVFIGGNILVTKKTSYADIINSNSLTEIVRAIMDEQHKKVIVAIKRGKLDKNGLIKKSPAPKPAAAAGGEAAGEKKLPEVPISAPAAEPAPAPDEKEPGLEGNAQPDGGASTTETKKPKADEEGKSFDDLILENLSLDKK